MILFNSCKGLSEDLEMLWDLRVQAATATSADSNHPKSMQKNAKMRNDDVTCFLLCDDHELGFQRPHSSVGRGRYHILVVLVEICASRGW